MVPALFPYGTRSASPHDVTDSITPLLGKQTSRLEEVWQEIALMR
jgi:hypothetical protein